MICAIHLESPDTLVGLSAALSDLTDLSEPATVCDLINIPAQDSIPQLCLEINKTVSAYRADRVILIVSGAHCLDLPAIAKAQTAVHRSVISYALINPIFPVSTDQWPNAPVTVYLPVNQDPDRSVSLRGFDISHYSSTHELAKLIVGQLKSAQ